MDIRITGSADFKWACEQSLVIARNGDSWLKPKDIISGALELLDAMDEYNKKISSEKIKRTGEIRRELSVSLGGVLGSAV